MQTSPTETEIQMLHDELAVQAVMTMHGARTEADMARKAHLSQARVERAMHRLREGGDMTLRLIYGTT